ncbi:MAG TPA: tRNA (guanine(46)-N(7))-methyltransferase TrmB [Rhizomicrobium sp.]|nr:tRNA (guanine(46)-N(7))-methyltransferase TrmB [Rhizomicrobium sp.]
MLYGRRKGPKLSAHQAHLRETLLPQLSLRLEHGRDPRSYFSPPAEDVWLEVGYGGGEHLLWQAEHNPHVGLIGAEPYEGGTAKLLSKLEAARARNLRLYEGDAREIVDMLPDASIGRVFILFPDPWPKTRHHKRRFIQMEMLDRLARVTRPGAELRFATDDATYLLWALERIAAHPMFEWTAACAADWTTRPPDWPQTRYEAKAIQGPPAYLRFRRSARLQA